MSVVAARRAGALMIIARQFEQSVKLRAESDRAIYHALGAGKSVVESIHWARQSLARSDQRSYQWATLTLTTCDVKNGEQLVNLAFPPVFAEAPSQAESDPAKTADEPESTRQSGSSAQAMSGGDPTHAQTQSALSEGTLRLAKRRRSLPTPAPLFVQDTVSLIQRSQ